MMNIPWNSTRTCTEFLGVLAVNSRTAPVSREGAVGHKMSFWSFLIKLVAALRPDVILEWGPGNSTHAFVKGCDAIVYAMEDNKEWYDLYMNEFAEKMTFNELARVKMYLHAPKSVPYINAINIDTSTVDIFFIDGGSRGACLERAMLVGKKDAIILIHDSEFGQYNKIMYDHADEWVVVCHHYSVDDTQETTILVRRIDDAHG